MRRPTSHLPRSYASPTADLVTDTSAESVAAAAAAPGSASPGLTAAFVPLADTDEADEADATASESVMAPSSKETAQSSKSGSPLSQRSPRPFTESDPGAAVRASASAPVRVRISTSVSSRDARVLTRVILPLTTGVSLRVLPVVVAGVVERQPERACRVVDMAFQATPARRRPRRDDRSPVNGRGTPCDTGLKRERDVMDLQVSTEKKNCLNWVSRLLLRLSARTLRDVHCPHARSEERRTRNEERGQPQPATRTCKCILHAER